MYASITFLKNMSCEIDTITSKSGQHSLRVANWACTVANRMGYKEAGVQVLCYGALFHDIGKIGIPKQILGKKGPLTEDEWMLVKLHPVIGYSILQATKLMPEVASIVHAHQEKYNGEGYPVGLEGKDIPLGARILSVVDAYDAMTDDRPYRKACCQQDAIAELDRMRGYQFDPLIVDIFFEILETDSVSATIH
jgi:putative nucleotidyltransferase with HDIG domain